MEIIAAPVTGQEPHEDTALPNQALALFYAAINSRDINAMQTCWSSSEEASMNNPLGGIERGWSSIKAVYSRLFNAPIQYNFVFHDYTMHSFSDCFLVVGREHGWIEKNGQRLDLAFRTSRFFRLENLHWRQFHHHGSADNAVMLREYQALVLGKKY